MAENSNIEWTHHTHNPWVGCSKVSPGCKHCYAERDMDKRRGFAKWGDQGTRVVTSESNWRKPLAWDRKAKAAGERHRVFCASLADVFEDREELVAPRERLFALMSLTPNLDWLVLTKRPEVMARYISDPATPGRVAKAVDAMLVSEAMRAIPERIEPFPGAPGYFISNHGNFMTARGTLACLHCGAALDGDPRKKFCSAKCKSAAHYAQKQSGEPRAEAEARLARMTPDVGEQGHERVSLRSGGTTTRWLVHRAVLIVFERSPNSPNEQACHRDGNPRNNHIANLRWGTQSDNWSDRRRHGNGRSYAKLTPQQVRDIRSLARSQHRYSIVDIADGFGVSETQVMNILAGRQWAEDQQSEWPPRNFWAGTSVEDQQRADERIPLLLQTPAAIRFLSVEPMLGPVDLRRLTYRGDRLNPLDTANDMAAPHIDWIIVGGESGPNARPLHPDWARSIRDQCQAAGVPFFFKQWGEWAPQGSPHVNRHGWINAEGEFNELERLPHGLGRHPVAGWSTTYRVGKRAAGRILDGRTWDEFPKGVA